jgi:hypothetical protein
LTEYGWNGGIVVSDGNRIIAPAVSLLQEHFCTNPASLDNIMISRYNVFGYTLEMEHIL